MSEIMIVMMVVMLGVMFGGGHKGVMGDHGAATIVTPEQEKGASPDTPETKDSELKP